MKKLFTIFVTILLTAGVFAQAPQKMSYQAVIRDASNNLVTNHAVAMQITILQNTTTIYTETQTPTTNANGLASIEIGGGAEFSTIDWANGPYFIKTETDPTGGTTYSITGTSQLLSVPYALHAKTAETFTGTISETDPIFGASSANGITSINITNWTSAYGWGNHSGLYRPIAWVPEWTDITSKPTFATVATSGSYSDLNNIPVNATTTTDGMMSSSDKTKLNGIVTGAEVNVNADWNASSGDAQILNKPTIPTIADGSETKLTAGTNVTVTGAGTTSSPYVVNANSGSHYLGEEYLGGIIFYLYTDNTGTQKGLIVSKTESTATWSGSTVVGANKTSNGAFNMNLMPLGAGTARTWVQTLGADWYLPSIDELSILWHNRFHVNNSSASGLTLLSATAAYWSSNEGGAANAYDFRFDGGSTGPSNKLSDYSVRAIRAF